MEETTMGKIIEMRVHTMLSQEESNKEIKEEVDPVDKANSRLSVEMPKEKGSQETRVGRNSKVFADIVECKDTKHQIVPSRNKE
jgi:hypothetical protein